MIWSENGMGALNFQCYKGIYDKGIEVWKREGKKSPNPTKTKQDENKADCQKENTQP